MNTTEPAEILAQFEKCHPKLISFDPEIEIVEIEIDENGMLLNPPTIKIYVWHPFIFDNRLIPKEFLGTEVVNATRSNTIPEIFNPKSDIPLWEVENPSNYISFVENNINEIRLKLKSESLSRYDALDALTGNFSQHLKRWEGLLLMFFGER